MLHPLFEVRAAFFMDRQELEEALSLPGATRLLRVFEGAIAEFDEIEEKQREFAARARAAKLDPYEKEFVPMRERGRFDNWSAPMLMELVRFLNNGTGESKADA